MCATKIWRDGRRDWIIIGWDPVVGYSRHGKEPSYPIQGVDFDDPNNCESVAVIMSSESRWLRSYRFWWRVVEASTVRKSIIWNLILVVLMEQNITLYEETTSVRFPICDLVPATKLGFPWNSWYQTFAAVHMRPALFWDLTQHRLVISYRRFVTTYRSHHQGSNGLLCCPETSVWN